MLVWPKMNRGLETNSSCAFLRRFKASTWTRRNGVSFDVFIRIGYSADMPDVKVNLDVHFMKDVVWNTEAFDYLVIEKQTKDLVQALVTNQLRASENADLIQGKGNGLFILLHG